MQTPVTVAGLHTDADASDFSTLPKPGLKQRYETAALVRISLSERVSVC